MLAEGLAGYVKPASLKVATRNTTALAFYHRLGWENTDETGHCDITGPWRTLMLVADDLSLISAQGTSESLGALMAGSLKLEIKKPLLAKWPFINCRRYPAIVLASCHNPSGYS
ncbi:hypothetical protein D3C80_1898310 [compost metagenome]